MTRFVQLAIAATGATFVLIAVGGVSIPNSLHVAAALAAAVLICATAVASLTTRGTSRRTVASAWVAAGSIAVQGIIALADPVAGFRDELHVLHIGLAMTCLGANVVTAVFASADVGSPGWLAQLAPLGATPNPDRRFVAVSASAAAVIFTLIVSGTVTRSSGASLSCEAWPWCSSGTALPDGRSVWIDLSHRTTAIIGGLTVAFLFWQAMRLPVARPARRLAQSIVGVTILQMLIGGGYVVTSGSGWLSALHLAAAAVMWSSLILLVIAARLPAESAQPTLEGLPVVNLGGGHGLQSAHLSMATITVSQGSDVIPGAGAATFRPGFALFDFHQLSTTASEYIALTKPGILTLLLATTLGGLLAGAASIPPLGLVLFTMVGGALAAGGANALNCYIDRDIDALMSRTKKRGTVTGTISPASALSFGLALTISSVLLLGLTVNWLAAGLALLGNVYYVLVYTKWLKRRTPHNIVIGGAAGAMPPVVGWAAATGNVSIAAVLMFAVIYYWTPPHFWALALLKQGEYGRAAVPMMPNVRGEDETRWQMLLYTVMLAAVSLMLVPFGMGWIYLIGAIACNGMFLWYVIRLYRSPSKALARRTFFYSLWFLALIFGAMVADRLILA